MLSGKAISRAIQGHIIVDSFLDGMLLSKAFRMPKFLEETETEEVELSNKILSIFKTYTKRRSVLSVESAPTNF